MVLISCSDVGKKKLETDDININYRSVRFDKAFFNIDTNNIAASLDSLGNQYPDFTNLFLTRLASLGQPGTPRFDTALHQFLTLKDYRDLWDSVQTAFPDTKKIDAELEETFKNIKYFYPTEELGMVYYFVSGLNLWSAITIDSAIGVGLDMYLGADFPFYSAVQIPAYEAHNRTPDRIPIEVAQTIFTARFPYTYENKTLLDMMLRKGRELYFIEQVCRDKTDDKIIGYTPEQLKWANENEDMVYYFFVKADNFYSSIWQDIMPYVNDGPNTAGMPPESPGNIGSWLGWQIVRQYMKTHPEMTLQKLMALKIPSQDFLRQAKYKP